MSSEIKCKIFINILYSLCQDKSEIVNVKRVDARNMHIDWITLLLVNIQIIYTKLHIIIWLFSICG